MLLPERALQFPDRGRLAFELCKHAPVRTVLHEAPDSERTGPTPNELPEAHSLHPADEPEPHPDRGHAEIPPDLK